MTTNRADSVDEPSGESPSSLTLELSGITGIAPSKAAALAERFGHDRRTIMAATLEQLTDVEGVGPAGAKRVQEALVGPPDPLIERFKTAAATRSDDRTQREFVSVKIRRDIHELVIAIDQATGLGRQHILTDIVASWASSHPAYLHDLGVKWESHPTRLEA